MVLTFPAAYHNRNVIFFNLVYIALWWLINFFFFFFVLPTRYADTSNASECPLATQWTEFRHVKAPGLTSAE